MIRISRMTDYSLLLLSYVARSPTGLQTARELAGLTQLPAPTVSKLLKTLARADLLKSQRGVSGGYSLARPAESISMADIITALEGPIALTQCSEGPGMCDLESRCHTRANLKLINDAIHGALKSVTIAAMTQPFPDRLITLGADSRTEASATRAATRATTALAAIPAIPREESQ